MFNCQNCPLRNLLCGGSDVVDDVAPEERAEGVDPLVEFILSVRIPYGLMMMQMFGTRRMTMVGPAFGHYDDDLSPREQAMAAESLFESIYGVGGSGGGDDESTVFDDDGPTARQEKVDLEETPAAWTDAPVGANAAAELV